MKFEHLFEQTMECIAYVFEKVEFEKRIKVEVQDKILFRGLYANFIPIKLDEGIMELMKVMQILCDSKWCKYFSRNTKLGEYQ